MSIVHYYLIWNKRSSVNRKVDQPANSEVIGLGVLLLIGGWLADAFFGRYRVICCGMWVMWIGALLSTLSYIVSEVSEIYMDKGDRWISLVSNLIMGIGFGLFQANIVQFGIDQLSEASSVEITNFITCYILTFFASSLTVFFSAKCTPDYVGVLLITLCLSLTLCSYFLFNHWLMKEQIIQNPLPLIWKVIRYCIKNNHLQKRFSSFKRKGILSRLDIAKTMYTGPFSSEQVEDVKTFFRVLLVIASCILAHTGVATVSTVKKRILPHLSHWPVVMSNSTSDCYKAVSIVHSGFIFVILAVILYMTVVQPAVSKCIPNITTKFIIALVLYFFRILALLAIESVSYYYQRHSNITNITRCYLLQSDTTNVRIEYGVYWVFIPQSLDALSIFFLVSAAMQFVCAQAPFNMKGLVIGLGYTIFGFGTIINTAISVPFLYVKASLWEKAPLTCGIWYFLIQSVIAIVGFAIMVVVIKSYKNRERINVLHSDWQDTDSEDQD